MKQAKIVALILFIILIAAGVAEQYYIKRIFIRFDGYTAALERALNATDTGGGTRKTDGVNDADTDGETRKTDDVNVTDTDGKRHKIAAADIDSAMKTLVEFDEWWGRESQIIESLCHNRDIKGTAQEIYKLEELLKIRNISEAQISLAALKATAKNLEQALTFRLEHII